MITLSQIVDWVLPMREEFPLLPRLRWGIITAISPSLTVMMDGETAPRVDVSTISSVSVGSRCLMATWNRRTVVLGVAGGVADGYRLIGGQLFKAEGSWNVAGGLPPWVITTSPYALTLQLVPPFMPPEGWTFETFTLTSDGFTFCQTGSFDRATNRVNVRVTQVGNPSLTALATVGWRLIKIS